MQQDSNCRAKMGLLFLRECGDPSKRQCDSCGRPICKKHMVNSTKGKEVLCPECASYENKHINDPSEMDESVPWSVRHSILRSSYYHDYRYRPYFHGSHYYNDSDYNTFDDQAANNSSGADESLGSTAAEDWESTES